MTKRNKEIKQEIIQLYLSGLSMKKVGEKYQVSPATVKRILDANNVPTRTKGGIYKIPDEEVIDRYNKNESCQSIADSYHVSFHTISNILEKHGIPRNNRYYNLDLKLDYFEQINSYDKAYFLGFLITDGNVIGNSVRLSLHPKDAYILKVFKDKTKNSNSLYYRKDKPEVSLSVKNQKWVNDLSNFGVIPNKTSTVYLPQLEEKYMPHLIRGMIDGDGWISYKSHQIGFCGNHQTVTQLRDYLVDKLGVYQIKILHTNISLWQISWASKKDIEKIGQYLYKDAKDCFLNRKYQNFLQIQGNTEVINQTTKG